MKKKLLPALILTVLAAGAARLGIQALELRVEVHDLELIPRTSEVLATDERIRKIFGGSDFFIIALESEHHGVDSAAFAVAHQSFFDHLTSHPNIETLVRDRFGSARFRPPEGVGPPLRLPDAEWISAALEHNELFQTLGVSHSARASFLEAPALSLSAARGLEKRTKDAARALEERWPGEYQVRLLGRAVVLNGLGTAIENDLVRLMPWTFGVILALMLVAFRSLSLALAGLLEVGMTVGCTLGLLHTLGYSISLMTALVPVLVTVLGIADEIHLFAEFFRHKEAHPGLAAGQHARAAVAAVFFPVTATSLTTAIGFFSFTVTGVPALEVFGVIAAIGVLLSWFFTLTFVPAALCLLPVRQGPDWARHSRRLRLPRLARKPLALALTLILVPGILALEIDDGWMRNLTPSHPIVQDVAWFQEESVGLYQFDVLLELAGEGRFTEPERLAHLESFTDKAERLAAVSTAIAISDLVRDRAWELGELTAPRPPIPASQSEIRRLLHTFRVFNEQIYRLSFLDHEERRARVMVFMKGDDYRTSSQVKRQLAALVDEHFDTGQVGAGQVGAGQVDAGVTSRIGGSAERGRVLVGSLIATQLSSIATAGGLAFLALGAISGDWRRAGRAVVAVFWALLLVLGLAGWLGLTFGVASSTFLAMGMGVGLDYAIHLAFPRRAREETPDAGILGLRVVANVLIAGLGFLVLTLAINPTIRQLGLLVTLAMAACGYAALVFFQDDERKMTP